MFLLTRDNFTRWRRSEDRSLVTRLVTWGWAKLNARSWGVPRVWLVEWSISPRYIYIYILVYKYIYIYIYFLNVPHQKPANDNSILKTQCRRAKSTSISQHSQNFGPTSRVTALTRCLATTQMSFTRRRGDAVSLARWKMPGNAMMNWSAEFSSNMTLTVDSCDLHKCL